MRHERVQALLNQRGWQKGLGAAQHPAGASRPPTTARIPPYARHRRRRRSALFRRRIHAKANDRYVEDRSPTANVKRRRPGLTRLPRQRPDRFLRRHVRSSAIPDIARGMHCHGTLSRKPREHRSLRNAWDILSDDVPTQSSCGRSHHNSLREGTRTPLSDFNKYHQRHDGARTIPSQPGH